MGIGAAAAIAIITTKVEALVKGCTIETGSVRVGADFTGAMAANAVSGSDPLNAKHNRPTTTYNDIALDASVAVNKVNTTVRAEVDADTTILTHGGNSVPGVVMEDLKGKLLGEQFDKIAENAEQWAANSFGSDEEKKDEPADPRTYYNVYIYANSVQRSLAKASCAAVGADAAVGAAVAVNLMDSHVEAVAAGSGTLSGDLGLVARALNSDDAYALASSTGADIARQAQVFTGVAEGGEEILVIDEILAQSLLIAQLAVADAFLALAHACSSFRASTHYSTLYADCKV